MTKTSFGGIADIEEQRLVLQTVLALETFALDKSIKDDEKVWITKKEAFLLCSLIFRVLNKAYGSDQDVPEEQQD